MRTRISVHATEFKTKLNKAFSGMRKRGLVARQHFFCCGNCASHELATILKAEPNLSKEGCAYYHKQDAESLPMAEVYIGFGGHPSQEGEAFDASTIAAGKIVVEELQKVGLAAEWNGSPLTRILAKWQEPPPPPPAPKPDYLIKGFAFSSTVGEVVFVSEAGQKAAAEMFGFGATGVSVAKSRLPELTAELKRRGLIEGRQ